jgi:hypothetical protein
MKKGVIEKTLLVVLSLVLFVGIWIWAGSFCVKEGLEPGPATSHTVDLPINTTTSCVNVCGPQARCSLTGQQCTSDVDCYGCQPPSSSNKNAEPETVVRPQNNAGKYSYFQPTYSYLTTDIGTKAYLYKDQGTKEERENIKPTSYVLGSNEWKPLFDQDKKNYDKMFGTTLSSSLQKMEPKYKTRPTLTGEFEDVGPLAANAFL